MSGGAGEGGGDGGGIGDSAQNSRSPRTVTSALSHVRPNGLPESLNTIEHESWLSSTREARPVTTARTTSASL